MSEYKSHRIKIENIPKQKPMCSVGNKDFFTVAFMWVIIIAGLYITNSILLVAPLIVYGFFLAFKPYKGSFDGYNSFFVIYHQGKKGECDLYYLSELKYWSLEGSFFNPSIKLFLNDGQKIVIEKAVDSEISDYFRKVAAKKEIEKKK